MKKYNLFRQLQADLKKLPPTKIEIISDNEEDKEVADQFSSIWTYLVNIQENDKKTFTFSRMRSFQDMTNDLIDGMKYAMEQCPDAENKTFEEIAEWAGQHVMLTEKTEEK